MNKDFRFVFAGLFLLLTGCSSFLGSTQRMTGTFTLNVPEAVQKTEGFAVEPFTSSSPAKYKMLVRRGNAVQTEPFAKWVMTPEKMVTVCYEKMLSQNTDNKGPEKILSGNILDFAKVVPEADKKGRTYAFLCIRYTVKTSSGKILLSTVFTDSAPVSDDTPEAFASAMNRAFAQQSARLIKTLGKIK